MEHCHAQRLRELHFLRLLHKRSLCVCLQGMYPTMMVVIVALQQTQEDILSKPQAQPTVSLMKFRRGLESVAEEGESRSENA